MVGWCMRPPVVANSIPHADSLGAIVPVVCITASSLEFEVEGIGKPLVQELGRARANCFSEIVLPVRNERMEKESV